MLLADWLRQDLPLGDQLPVMDSLCQGVTAAHRRSPPRALAMDPQKITVAGGGDCHIQEGTAPTAYRAPESHPGVPASQQADIYSLGVLLYQMLARRHPSGLETPRAAGAGQDDPRPVALRDVRPDVPRDLVDAIMACLEPDPEWRPKDLEYLLSVARLTAAEHPPSPASAAPIFRAEPDAPTAAAALAAARKRAAPPARSSPATLAAVAVGLLVVAAVGWYFAREPRPGGAEPGPAPLPATPPPAATPTPSPLPSPSPVPSARPVTQPSAPAAVRSPVRAAALPEAAPTPALPSATPVPSHTPPPRAEPTPDPAPTAAPAEPAVLTTLSPPRVKRPGNAIVDVRGTGLRADHVARLVRGREAAPGIQILRQRYVGPNLIQVALRLEDTAAPGSYQLYVIDGQGTSSNARALEVTR
jgi:hypothetical protein